MKTAKTVISIVFVIGTVAIIVHDGQTSKKPASEEKKDSSKIDSIHHQGVKK